MRRATVPCQFGRPRNCYVATQSNLFSNTADSSPTSGNVVVPERFGQIEEPATRNEERGWKS